MRQQTVVLALQDAGDSVGWVRGLIAEVIVQEVNI